MCAAASVCLFLRSVVKTVQKNCYVVSFAIRVQISIHHLFFFNLIIIIIDLKSEGRFVLILMALSVHCSRCLRK